MFVQLRSGSLHFERARGTLFAAHCGAWESHWFLRGRAMLLSSRRWELSFVIVNIWDAHAANRDVGQGTVLLVFLANEVSARLLVGRFLVDEFIGSLVAAAEWVVGEVFGKELKSLGFLVELEAVHHLAESRGCE